MNSIPNMISPPNHSFTFLRLVQVRQFISDFAVIIAILTMSSIDMAIGIHTPKLDVRGRAGGVE